MLNRKIVVVVENSLFDIIKKHLSSFYDDNHCVFIHSNKNLSSPSGFVSNIARDKKRAQGLMVAGLEKINTIVSSHAGLDMPLVGSGSSEVLYLNEKVDYNLCSDFLQNENYANVDNVVCPGEFSKRGAVIDLFPFSSTYPIRINFF